MLPALFAVSVGQINLLLDTILASFLETGSIAWLYYSDRLLELPLALFGIAIATVILPNLSKDHAEADADAFNAKLNWGLRLVLLLGVPASAALIYLARPLIGSIFYQGEMTARDVDQAGLALQAYGVGLVALMLVKVLAPGYFARQDTRTPVRYGLIALVTNMVLNLILVWPLALLRVDEVPGRQGVALLVGQPFDHVWRDVLDAAAGEACREVVAFSDCGGVDQQAIDAPPARNVDAAEFHSVLERGGAGVVLPVVLIAVLRAAGAGGVRLVLSLIHI